MPTIKVVVSDPLSGKSKQVEVKDPVAQRFIGLRIGDEIDAQILKDYVQIPPGFKIRITGGSGIEGAPMYPGVRGPVKRYALLSKPPGHWPAKRGLRKRKLVRGDTVSEHIVQVNTVLVYPPDWDKGPIIPLGDKELERFQKLQG